MFVGHYAVGLAAKRIAPRTSLGTIVLAAVFADVLVWALVVAGVEHIAIKPGITATNALDLYDYPISHSLLMDAFWGALFGGVYFLVTKYWRGTVIIFAAVLSHWVLDFIAHRPDMPLAPGVHAYYGLGLYNSRAGMMIVEGLMWLAGIVLYVHTTRSKKRLGGIIFWIGIALFTWVWLVSLKGLPPAGTLTQVGIESLVFVGITLAWAYWVDRLRSPTSVINSNGLTSEERKSATSMS